VHRSRALIGFGAIAALAVIASLLIVTGASARQGSTKAGPLSGKHFVFSECCQDPMFTTSWLKGMKAAMKWSHAGESISVTNANSDNTTQLSQVESFIGQKVDAILTVTESGTGYAPLVKKAQAAGIVYANYSGNPAPGANWNIIYPHYQAGYMTGVDSANWLKQTNNGVGDAGVTVNPTDPGLTSRTTGFIAGVKSVLPNIKIWKAAAPHGSIPDGATVAQNLLGAHSSIKILFCYNETLSLGCVQGAAQAGRTDPKNLYISDADATKSGFDLILKGTPLQHAVTPNFTGNCAVWMLMTELAVEGKPIPHLGVSNVRLVTPANVKAAISAEADPFSKANIKTTLSSVRLYKQGVPPYSNSKLPKGPGIQNFFGKNPKPEEELHAFVRRGP
jgi:ABC-type sugar transport system substrate-binding protein